MAADEALARQLQQEEEALAARQQQQDQARAHYRRATAFAQQVEGAVSKALGYENELAQAMALSIMPMLQLEADAEEACAVSAAMGEQPPLDCSDALAFQLLSWFKQSFFSWVNAPPCDACGSSNTQNTGMGEPTAEEAAHQAGRIEVYSCGQCGATTRFPRYNDPVKLLETRRGRCGEWANCFTLCCRAAGLEARLAMDWEDHIWTEYYSPTQLRWLHLDPCEGAADKPLLYEAGWGKKLSYVVAVGRHGVADVTRRYSKQYDETLGRREQVSEVWLARFLADRTARLRASLPAEERRELELRDEAERRQLLGGFTAGTAGATGTAAAAEKEEQEALPARQTGDAAWLAARGEDGSSLAANSGSGSSGGHGSAAKIRPAGTRYRLAKDEVIAAANPRRLCGGAVRASGENGPAEAALRLFDGSPGSKWLDFGKAGAWVEYRLPSEQAAAVLAAYALTSANDSPERDPRHVVLEAWQEGNSSWVCLDEQRSLSFPRRHHRLVLRIAGGDSGPLPSRRFRLRVLSVADPAAANSVQLACLDLFVLKRATEAEEKAWAASSAEQHPETIPEQQEQQPAESTEVVGQVAEQAVSKEQAAASLDALEMQEVEQAQRQHEAQQAEEEEHKKQAQQQQDEQPPPPPQPAPPVPVLSPGAPAPTVPPPSASSGTAAAPANPWAALFQGGPPT